MSQSLSNENAALLAMVAELEASVATKNAALTRVFEWCVTEDPNFEIEADAIQRAIDA